MYYASFSLIAKSQIANCTHSNTTTTSQQTDGHKLRSCEQKGSRNKCHSTGTNRKSAVELVQSEPETNLNTIDSEEPQTVYHLLLHHIIVCTFPITHFDCIHCPFFTFHYYTVYTCIYIIIFLFILHCI